MSFLIHVHINEMLAKFHQLLEQFTCLQKSVVQDKPIHVQPQAYTQTKPIFMVSEN